MKKALSRLLSVIIVISAMTVVFFAAGAQDYLSVYADSSGTCGESLTWTYEDSTKTLTIRGTGPMADYRYYGPKPPWMDQGIEDRIEKIVIEEGVTSIGKAAFLLCSNANEVSIPSSVTGIGEGAFQYCNSLAEIVIPEGVRNIGQASVAYCDNLKTITIPGTVTKIEGAAFAYNMNLEKVIFQKPGKGGQTLTIGNSPFMKLSHDPISLVLEDPLDNPIDLYNGETQLEENYNLESLSNVTLTWNAPAGIHFNHDGTKFTEWSSNYSMPKDAGNYYLANDVTIYEPSSGIWTVPEGTVNLCLNGNDITNQGSDIIVVPNGATLNIYDPDGGGRIFPAQSNTYGITVEAGGTLNFYEGTITGCKRGIYANGGKVTIGRKGSDPQLDNEYSVYAENGAEVSINSGTISGGTSLYAGGGTKVDLGDGLSASNEIYVKGSANVSGSEVMVYAGHYDNDAYAGLKDCAAPMRKFADDPDGAPYTKKVVEVLRKYNVKTDVNITRGGTISANTQNACVNERVTLTIKPKSGYTLKELTITDGVYPELTVNGGTTYASFKMPERNVYAEAIFVKAYNINYDIIHGTVENKKTVSYEGEEITLQIDPEDAHVLAYIIPEGVELKKLSDTEYKFKMPANNVKISAAYLKKENHSFNGKEKEAFIWDVDHRMPTVGGAYVIDTDVSMVGYTEYYVDTDLCLNGHSITLGRPITIKSGHTLNIYDETGSGVIQPSGAQTGIHVANGSKYNMYGGTIKVFDTAVMAASGRTQVNIYKGTISGGRSFVMGETDALTIGSEGSSQDSIYISGTMEYRYGTSVTLYAGHYDYYSYNYLTNSGKEENRCLADGRSFADSDIEGYYKKVEEAFFTVTFTDGQGNTIKTETVRKGMSATAPGDPEREGYTFDGWDTDFSRVTSDLTVTAKWKQNLVTYQVTFEDGLGNVLDKQTVVSGRPATAPAEPTRDRYMFSGWDTDFSNVISNLTVKALWTEESHEEDSFTVVFVIGFGRQPVTRVVKEGGLAVAPENPTVDGFTFTGWDKEFTNVTKDLTVTAQWRRNTAEEGYTVTFVNGYPEATGPIATIHVKYGQAVNPPADPARDGYTFEGWDTDFSYVTENLTVIAKWKQKSYTVTFTNGYDEASVIDTQTVLHGHAATAPAAPTREGYTFEGWDTNFSCVTENLTVNAQWKQDAPAPEPPTPAEKYIVTFVDGQGTTLKTETVEKGKAATAPADPAREGYTFEGWDTDFSYVTENMTVIAQWKQNAPSPTPGPDPDDPAGTVKTVSVNSKTVSAKAVKAAIAKAGGSSKYVTTIVLGKKVKKISKGAFKSYKKIKTLTVKSKKLKKSTVRKSLKGSKITRVKVKVSSKKKINKKYVKKYKKIFTKQNAGKKVKVRS